MVCLQEKTTLLKKGLSFKTHVEHDHDFWKYSDYLAYLTSKDKADQTGFENSVWENYSVKQVAWIPFKDNDPDSLTPAELEEKEAAKIKAETDFKDLVKEKFDGLEKKLAEVIEKMPKKEEKPAEAQPAEVQPPA
jgi:hypothetical protein